MKRRGREVKQQTRSYNAGMSVTEALREKRPKRTMDISLTQTSQDRS